MVEINANIRLRPIRIGFLVRPNDLASVQEVMRYCAAVWGGVYNPFIPVFSKPPKSWASDPFDRVRGIGVAKGYIRKRAVGVGRTRCRSRPADRLSRCAYAFRTVEARKAQRLV